MFNHACKTQPLAHRNSNCNRYRNGNRTSTPLAKCTPKKIPVQQQQLGFTLLELLLVLAVAAVLILVGIDQFQSYQRRLALRQTAVSIQLLKQAIPVFYQAHCLKIITIEVAGSFKFTIPSAECAQKGTNCNLFVTSGVLPRNWQGLMLHPLTEAYQVLFATFAYKPEEGSGAASFTITAKSTLAKADLASLQNYARRLGANPSASAADFTYTWTVYPYQISEQIPSGPLDAHLRWFKQQQQIKEKLPPKTSWGTQPICP